MYRVQMYREREKLPSNKFILILLLLPEAKPIGHRLQQVLVVVVVVLSNPDFTCTWWATLSTLIELLPDQTWPLKFQALFNTL